LEINGLQAPKSKFKQLVLYPSLAKALGGDVQ